ncbi:S41 family peptidase [Pseudohongiella spirulinae]|uniref:Carboxyl-terminal protease n=1 Tax=Pseudohongiella spirulinae TaxID=1249552 RepID=A0A0S2K9X2_9GAMM|nr:S41 family peptidase [Pseudohongiella spirulinae]ALO45148.1 Carboxyl-terminal protease [Pseudohongiella spirulinae]
MKSISSARLNRAIRIISTTLAGALTAACLSLSAHAQPEDAPRPLPIDEVRLFAEALEAIRTAYVQDIDDKSLIDLAIRGMLAGLDPHSAYLSADDYDSLQENTEGQFGGLGIEVGEENGYIKVITPLDDSPAARAGVLPGDLIIEINGRPVREMIVNDAVELLRGEPGSTVDLTLMRENETEPLDLTLTREIIAVQSVRHRMLEPGYVYLRIAQFRVNTGSEVVRTLQEIHQQSEEPLRGMVLDLRNNPGGVLQASVQVADAFLTEGRIVYTEGRFDESDEEFYADEIDPSLGVPLVVLINTGTASAAEIVAGALQDQGRAVIMGTRSFGKGSVQSVLPLNNERALKLTTSLYFTPSGRSIQASGIVPDIAVDEALVTRNLNRRGVYSERDLDGHLPGSEDDTRAGPRPVTSSEQVVVSDYQLNEALTLLKGWHIMQSGRQRLSADAQ